MDSFGIRCFGKVPNSFPSLDCSMTVLGSSAGNFLCDRRPFSIFCYHLVIRWIRPFLHFTCVHSVCGGLWWNGFLFCGFNLFKQPPLCCKKVPILHWFVETSMPSFRTGAMPAVLLTVVCCHNHSKPRIVWHLWLVNRNVKLCVWATNRKQTGAHPQHLPPVDAEGDWLCDPLQNHLFPTISTKASCGKSTAGLSVRGQNIKDCICWHSKGSFLDLTAKSALWQHCSTSHINFGVGPPSIFYYMDWCCWTTKWLLNSKHPIFRIHTLACQKSVTSNCFKANCVLP